MTFFGPLFIKTKELQHLHYSVIPTIAQLPTTSCLCNGVGRQGSLKTPLTASAKQGVRSSFLTGVPDAFRGLQRAALQLNKPAPIRLSLPFPTRPSYANTQLSCFPFFFSQKYLFSLRWSNSCSGSGERSCVYDKLVHAPLHRCNCAMVNFWLSS